MKFTFPLFSCALLLLCTNGFPAYKVDFVYPGLVIKPASCTGIPNNPPCTPGCYDPSVYCTAPDSSNPLSCTSGNFVLYAQAGLATDKQTADNIGMFSINGLHAPPAWTGYLIDGILDGCVMNDSTCTNTNGAVCYDAYGGPDVVLHDGTSELFYSRGNADYFAGSIYYNNATIQKEILHISNLWVPNCWCKGGVARVAAIFQGSEIIAAETYNNYLIFFENWLPIDGDGCLTEIGDFGIFLAKISINPLTGALANGKKWIPLPTNNWVDLYHDSPQQSYTFDWQNYYNEMICSSCILGDVIKNSDSKYIAVVSRYLDADYKIYIPYTQQFTMLPDGRFHFDSQQILDMTETGLIEMTATGLNSKAIGTATPTWHENGRDASNNIQYYIFYSYIQNGDFHNDPTIRVGKVSQNQAWSAYGFVKDNGMPVASGTVTATSVSGTTGSSTITFNNGYFALMGLNTGDYTISATKGSICFASRSITIANSDVEVPEINALHYNISGLTKQTFRSTPVANVPISLKAGDGTTTSTTSNQSGAYFFNGQNCGPYTVTPSPTSTCDWIPKSASVNLSGSNITVPYFGCLMKVIGHLGPLFPSSSTMTATGTSLSGETITQAGIYLGNGNFSFSLPEGSYQFTPSSQCAIFSPPLLQGSLSYGQILPLDFAASAWRVCDSCYATYFKREFECSPLGQLSKDACLASAGLEFRNCAIRKTSTVNSMLYNAIVLAVEVKRANGQPLEQTFFFDAVAEGDYFINLTSGNGLDKDSTISSASITLDEAQDVFSPSDFNKNAFNMSKMVHLVPGTHALTVRVQSKPDSYLTILVSDRDISAMPELP